MSCQVQPMPSTTATTERAAHSVAAAGSGNAPNGANARAVHGGYESRSPQRASANSGEGGMATTAGRNCATSYGSPPVATMRPATWKQWKSRSSYQPLMPAAKNPQTSESTSSRAAFAATRYRRDMGATGPDGARAAAR